MPKLTNGLSQKMKNFCHSYAESGNSTQAYLDAYATTDRRVACVQGSNLLKRDDVREYLQEINRPTVNKIANEREKKRRLLWKGIERCDAKEDEAGMARYIDLLNKMDAEYVNINRNIDDSSEKLSSLSVDQLKELISEPTGTDQ